MKTREEVINEVLAKFGEIKAGDGFVSDIGYVSKAQTSGPEDWVFYSLEGNLFAASEGCGGALLWAGGVMPDRVDKPNFRLPSPFKNPELYERVAKAVESIFGTPEELTKSDRSDHNDQVKPGAKNYTEKELEFLDKIAVRLFVEQEIHPQDAYRDARNLIRARREFLKEGGSL